MTFEWDSDKNSFNVDKHGVTFDLASEIFSQPMVTQIDGRVDYGEVRLISTVGRKEVSSSPWCTRRGTESTASSPPEGHQAVRGAALSKRYTRPLTEAELAVLPDSEIDFSDIPELDDAFWNGAKLIQPDRTQPVTLRVKQSVLDAFKASGKGYQTRMNAVLESYVLSLGKR